METKVLFIRLTDTARIPTRAYNTDAGMDIFADENISIPASDRVMVSTGLKMALPNEGYVNLSTGETFVWQAEIRPRSGLAIKHGITVINAPGTIDCVAKGTKIKTIDGDVLVEDLFKDNIVGLLSYNEEESIIEEDFLKEIWIVENVNCVELKTEDGNEITMSSEKEVYTKNGWKCVSDLSIGEEILCI